MPASTNRRLPGCAFHHVAIRVRDFDRVVRFYTDGLGFSRALSWGEGDGRAVMLNFGDGGCIEVFAGGGAETPPEGALLHLALCVASCDAALAAALAAGAVQTMAPTDITIAADQGPTPVRIAFCRGLAGEVLEFMQRKT